MFCTVWVCSTELFFAAWWDLLVFAADSVLRQQVLCVHVKLWIRHLHVTVLITSLWPSCDTPRLRFFNYYFFSMLPSVWMWGIYSETSIHYYNIPLNHSSTRLCMIHFFTCSSCTILFPPWSQVSGICVVCHRQLIRLVRVLWSLKSLGKMISALKVYGKWIIQLRSVKVCQFWLLSVLTSSVKLRSARDFLTVFLAAWLHALAD